MEINKLGNDVKNAYLEENCGKSILPLSIVENIDLPGLNPLDVLLFYKKGISLLKIRESFFKTLDYYNLFSSRMIMTDQDKFALLYCTDGAQLNILPSIDVTMDNINIDDVKNMMVQVKTLPGKHLFAVTVIPIQDGMLAGISCSHAVADGIALILFLYSWGLIIEGKDFPRPSPQRLFKGPPVRFDKINKKFIPPLSGLSHVIQNRVNHDNKVKVYCKNEYFSDELLNEIKNEARKENPRCLISNNQIMTSILLKKYHHRILPNTNKVIVKNPIDLRSVHPDIDSFYIGNAYTCSFTEFTKDEIDKMSTTEISYRLKESIAGMRNENNIKKMAYLSKYGIEFNLDMFQSYPPYSIEADLVSTNLTHMNDLESLGLDVNTGKILYLGISVPNVLAMLKEKSGSIFVQVTSRYPLS